MGKNQKGIAMNATTKPHHHDETLKKSYPDETICLRQVGYLLSAVVKRIQEQEQPHKKTRIRVSKNADSHGNA